MSAPVAQRFGPRAWLLFATMAVLWGMPYLFIKQAVESYSPAGVVAGRTLIGALLLLPFALRQGALRPALAQWRWVLAFAVLEMGAAFFLLGHAELTLPSGLTGLLVATVPLFAAVFAFAIGDRSALKPLRLTGLVLGFGGVAVIVAGPGLAVGSGAGLVAAGEVLLVAICYAIAPFIVVHKLNDVPSLGTVVLSLGVVGLFYLPIAILTQTEVPTVSSTVALGLLGVLSTAVAFVVFFALIGLVGPARAPLFTYVNPLVAIGLGVIVLGEELSLGLVVGMPLVIAGCWLAASGGVVRSRQPAAAAGEASAPAPATGDRPPPVAPG